MEISLTIVNCNGKLLVKFGNGDEYSLENQDELFLNGITDVHTKPRTDPWTYNCGEHP